MFHTMAALTDVESFFKVMKGVCTDNRASLSPKMVGVLLVCLPGLLRNLIMSIESKAIAISFQTIHFN